MVQLDLRKLGERAQVLQRDFNEAQNELHEVELRTDGISYPAGQHQVQSSEKFVLDLNDVILQGADAGSKVEMMLSSRRKRLCLVRRCIGEDGR